MKRNSLCIRRVYPRNNRSKPSQTTQGLASPSLLSLSLDERRRLQHRRRLRGPGAAEGAEEEDSLHQLHAHSPRKPHSTSSCFSTFALLSSASAPTGLPPRHLENNSAPLPGTRVVDISTEQWARTARSTFAFLSSASAPPNGFPHRHRKNNSAP